MNQLDRQDFASVLMIALIAGCVDATGFLQLGGFFVSFMSGNSTRLGLGLGSAMWREAGLALGLVATFVGGVTFGNLVGVHLPRHRRQALLVLDGILLGLAAACHQYGLAAGATVPMVLAMGMANTIFKGGAGVRFGVTYMTGALVKIGEHIAASAHGGSRSAVLPYAALWLSLVVGATLGARGYIAIGGRLLWIPAIAMVLLGLVHALMARQRHRAVGA